jgi:hypothetical protein
MVVPRVLRGAYHSIPLSRDGAHAAIERQWYLTICGISPEKFRRLLPGPTVRTTGPRRASNPRPGRFPRPLDSAGTTASMRLPPLPPQGRCGLMERSDVSRAMASRIRG